MFRSTRTLPAAVAISAAAILGVTTIGLAQEQSPDASAAASQAAVGNARPVDIHMGTCDELGDVLFPLGQISRDLMVHSEEAAAEPVGGVEDQQVALNLTLVEATLADLTGAPHALNIGASESDTEERIACGDIAGVIVNDGTLVIRLDEHDDSGYLGIGLFEEADDGNTAVYSMLTETESKVESPELPEPTPMESTSPSPDASAGAGGDIDIDIDVEGEDAADVDVDVEPEESPSA